LGRGGAIAKPSSVSLEPDMTTIQKRRACELVLHVFAVTNSTIENRRPYLSATPWIESGALWG